MDEFEQKHEMVQMLLDMLKRSASDEVMNGMKKPEGMPEGKGMEIEKVSVMPHEHMDGDPSPKEATLADKVMPRGEIARKMADGGEVNQNVLGQPEPTSQEAAGGMSEQDMADAQLRGAGGNPHSDENDYADQQASAFSSLMKRKGKK